MGSWDFQIIGFRFYLLLFMYPASQLFLEFVVFDLIVSFSNNRLWLIGLQAVEQNVLQLKTILKQHFKLSKSIENKQKKTYYATAVIDYFQWNFTQKRSWIYLKDFIFWNTWIQLLVKISVNVKRWIKRQYGYKVMFSHWCQVSLYILEVNTIKLNF